MDSNAAVMVIAPGLATSLNGGNVAVTGSASVEQTFSGYTKIWIKSDVDAYIVFGAAGSVTDPTTSNAQYMTANQDYVLDNLVAQTAFKVLRKGTTSGTVYWVKAA